MWPLLLDMTREESKRVLRRLELEAYSSVISVFRAQGDLTKEKKKQLQELQNTLSISTERHRAEVRRAVNDEKLCTIADNTFGPDTSSEWLIEGRRLVPLMPRLVPQTAFTLTANQAANMQAELNASLPTPSETGNKDLSSPPVVTTPTMTPTAVAKMPRPGSPSNVVVLPSGFSVHIKDEVEEVQSRKRKRSQSAEGAALGGDLAPVPHPRVSYTTQTSHSPSPMKITISKSPQTKTHNSVTTTPPQKVILLSSSGQSTAANILQKSVSVPVMRTGSSSHTTYTSGVPKTSIVYPGSSSSPASNGNLGNIVTVATTSALQNVSTTGAPSQVFSQQQGGSVGFATPTGALTKPRMKTVTRQRLTHSGVTSLTGQRPGLVVPMSPQSVHGVPHSGHMKTVGKPTIQIKQEGGMKIITQTLPTSSKLLPKPSALGSSGTPIVVVSSSSQTHTSGSVTMVTRPVTSSGVAASLGSKILNITTQGGKVIATTNKSPNVVTVNPKTLHLTAVKTAAGVAGGKPNVIVVQKSQGKKLIGQGTTMVTTKAGTSLPFEKELVSFIQKHDPQKIVTAKTLDNKVILTTSAHDFRALKKSRPEADGKTSLLAELIQAAGMSSDSPGSSSVTSSPIIIEESTPAGEITTTQSSLPIKAVTPALPPNLANEWFEYDVTDDVQSGSPASQPKPGQPASDLSQDSSGDPLSQDQFYTLEQAMSMVNPVPQTKGVAETEGVTVEGVGTTTMTDPASINQSQQIAQGKTPAEAEMKDSFTKLGSLTSVVPSLNPDLLPGDLDPQTGIFHSTGSSVHVGSSGEDTNKPASSQSMDLLSTSLAQAQIDLDPYEFMEEDMVALTSLSGQDVKVPPQATDLEPTKPVGQKAQKEALVSILTGNVVQDTGQSTAGKGQVIRDLPSSASQDGSEAPARATSSFIPLEELSNKASGASINITTQAPGLSGGDNSSVTVTMLPKAVDPGALTLDELTSQRLEASDEVLSAPSPEIDLTPCESSEVVGSQSTSEFCSQSALFGDQGSLSEPGNISDGGQSDSSLTRASKRRRKPPTSFDESPTPSSTGSWVRAALGILSKVSKVRGSNKDKSDFDASSWFLYPVDPEDAPDYFHIIQNPMDFSTIKRKLESSQYSDFDEFHADMMLVCENCNTYNPPGHQARQDCQEVFGIYHQEYSRLMDKWQKTHISSPVAKKLKLDKSPGKS
ncbi:BRCA2-interacting transcriptional repressor EMSY-like [Liolophura sinensis]|uniref:BRCA2-interacting transcriptional repressor EMSY-like n=1 Tax=Liolophura sinensis TaxID=3198878 RepID=UPI003159235B